jgi:putative membrane protein
MSDLLATLYPWIKSLHIISVISWMAALFYLPRLMVHHTERVGLSGETHDLFAMMEYKLAKVIMSPAMMATWILGVLAMTWFHIWLMGRMKSFQRGENTLSGKRYRMMNEVPTVLMFLIVFSVVVKF